MTDDAVGVGLVHLYLAGLLSSSYPKPFDGPVDCMTVGMPPVQRHVPVRISVVNGTVGVVQLPHQSGVESPYLAQIVRFGEKVELLEDITASDSVYRLTGRRIVSAGVLTQRKVIAYKLIVVRKIRVGGLQGLDQRGHIRIFVDLPPADRRFGKCIEIRVVRRTQQRLHRRCQLKLVVLVHIVRDAAHFVLEYPGHLVVERDILELVLADSFITNQLVTVANPSPPLIGLSRRYGHRNIVSHVPGVELPDGCETRLQNGDPLCKLSCVEEQPFVFELIGPHPQNVHCQPAKSPRCDGRKQQRRGKVLRPVNHQIHIHTLAIYGIELHAGANTQADG